MLFVGTYICSTTQHTIIEMWIISIQGTLNWSVGHHVEWNGKHTFLEQKIFLVISMENK